MTSLSTLPPAPGLTPGPWSIHVERDPAEDDPARSIASIRGEGGLIEVARVEVYADKDGNARLVAASPELFHLLREAIAWMDAAHRATPLSRSIVADARRVLASVEGR